MSFVNHLRYDEEEYLLGGCDMVLWCRACGAIMGVHEPYCDWRADRNGLCPGCAEKEKLLVFADSEINNSNSAAHLTGPHLLPEDTVITHVDENFRKA